MFSRGVALSVLIAAELLGADVEGLIVIKRRLTKRNVTVSASSYQRGVAVGVTPDIEEDPLAMERSRVVVYLEGQLPSKPVTAVMEQKGRRFHPDTLVIPAGSTVSFPNLDPIFHNVFSLSKPKSFDLGNYPKDQTRTITFQKPGIVFVHCHLHPNMAAAIVISPNRYSTKAEPDGRFSLRGVPPGTYTVVAWHKAAGFFRQKVQVGTSSPAPLTFDIPLEASAVAQAAPSK